MSMSPRLLRPRESFTPKSISGLALWLDGSDTSSLYTTDAGAVTAVSSPLEISGCVGWWDASDVASISATGTLVDEWDDKSPNGNFFSAAGSARPSTSTRTINGKNAIDFDGVANIMSANGVASIYSGNDRPLTLFLVFDPDTLPNPSTAISFNSSSSNLPYGQFFRTNGSIWEHYKRDNGNTTTAYATAGSASTSAAVLSAVVPGTTISSHTNGMAYASGTAFDVPDATYNRFSVGATNPSTGAGGFIDGLVGEIIVYNTALTTAQRASVEAYLAAKWGVSGVHAPATTAGDPVGHWADKSGNNRHATQSQAASRPTVTAVNSRKALAFNNANSVETSAYAAKATSTYFYVGRHNDSGEVYFQTGSTNGYHSHIVEAVSKFRRNEAGTNGVVLGSNLGSNALSVWSPFYSNALLEVRQNGATIGSTAIAATNVDASRSTSIGRFPGADAATYPLSGNICEFLIFQRALTSSERRRVEQYLATRWGITLAPQVSDPDAQDWVNRVYAAGSTVSQAAAAAVNTFVVGCKDDGIWTAMRKVLLLIGVDTFAGCAAHLKGTAPTFTNFSSANYSRTAGLQGVNTGYIRAAMRVSDLTASNSMHLAAWQTAANTAGATTFLANGQGGGGYLRDNVTNTGIRANSVEVLTINSRGNAGTMIGMSRNSTTQYGIVNGTVTSGASNVNDTATTTEYDLMGSGTSSSYLGRVSFFSFGDGIDLATLNARVSTLMSTLGSL